MDEWIDQYLRRLKNAKGVSEHTLRAYGTDLALFAQFCEERGVEVPSDLAPRALPSNANCPPYAACSSG
jgi:site-specific recombinase XerD